MRRLSLLAVLLVGPAAVAGPADRECRVRRADRADQAPAVGRADGPGTVHLVPGPDADGEGVGRRGRVREVLRGRPDRGRPGPDVGASEPESAPDHVTRFSGPGRFSHFAPILTPLPP